MVDPIGFLPAAMMPALQPLDEPALTEQSNASAGFAQMVSNGLQALNDKMLSTDLALQRLSSGAETNLHGVMMQLEDAKLSLQLALQVRNRLLDAYSELARMPI